MDFGFYGTLLFVVALLVVASKAFLTVPQGYQYTKERFGKFRARRIQDGLPGFRRPALHLLPILHEASRKPKRGRGRRSTRRSNKARRHAG